MKKLLFNVLPVVIIFLFSCKNTNIITPVTPAVNVSPLANNPDAPPAGTPVLVTPEQYRNYIADRQLALYECISKINIVAEAKQPGSSSKATELLAQIKKLTDEIKAMPPYMGSDVLQNAAVAFFEFYESKYQQAGMPLGENTAAETKAISTAKISTVEKELIAALQVQEQIFADVNHFVIQTNTIAQSNTGYSN